MSDPAGQGSGELDRAAPTRREVVGAVTGGLLGLAACRPAPPGARGLAFFAPEEFALLDELVEMIIPSDAHSPGARAAGVAAFLDARLGESTEPEVHEQWRSGLRLVDNIARTLYRKRFLELTPDQRVQALEEMAKNEGNAQTPEEKFFELLKTRTVRLYYTSKIGIHTEMEYKGNTILQEFVGEDVSKT